MADFIDLATAVKRGTRERQALELADAVLTGKLVSRAANTSIANAANAPVVSKPANEAVTDRKTYMRDLMRKRRAAVRAAGPGPGPAN